ncbi:MAG: DUF134 domain-containing protein [Bacteroidales bacterium]
MSPRIKTIRKVLNPPIIKGFKPYGPERNSENTDPVILLFEEYEAIRLCDYDKCNHQEASVLMCVSRPTFTRIYASALQKIAIAFVEGRQIAIEGGKVYFDSDWYQCKKCNCYFNNPEKEIEIVNCPLCGSAEIISFDFGDTLMDDNLKYAQDICVCSVCGSEQAHQKGKPCNEQICLKCNGQMKRKGSHNCNNLLR